MEPAAAHRVDVAAGDSAGPGDRVSDCLLHWQNCRPARGGLFLLCLVPRWVSDLIRHFGWILLLRETGVISTALQEVVLINGPVELLHNDAAVIVGLVYTVILFMIQAGYNLGGNGFTEQIYNQFITRFNWERGAAFGMLLLFTSAVIWLGLRLSGQTLANTVAKS
mgnify:CR=1 FL=1